MLPILTRLLLILSFMLSVIYSSARTRITDLDPYLFGDSLQIVRSSSYPDSLKKIRKNNRPSAKRVRAAQDLGDFFMERHTDSAFIYWNIAKDEATALGLDDEAMRIRMKIDSRMPFIGMGADGYTDFKTIDPSGFSPELKRAYYLAASEMYHNLSLKYPDSKQKNRLISKTVEAIDSLIPYYSADNPIHSYLYAYRSLITGNKSIAAASLAEILPSLTHRPSHYIYALYMLAEFYKDNPNRRDDYLSYLSQAAIASLRKGVINPSITAELGRELYINGDRKRGARCINLAFSASDSELGIYHMRNTSEYAPMLAGGDNRELMMRNVASAFLLLVIAALCIFLIDSRRMARKQAVAHNKTIADLKAETTELRTECRSYLSLAFLALEGLKDLNRYAHRKLTAGQAKDLFKDLEQGTFMQSQTDRFFEELDSLFLKSEPDFLNKLNSLLQPEQKLELMPGNRMSPELRIAALMRHGITDSSRIASVLGLSLNTVYTYRNRLKGRAIDRSTFESELANI